MAGVHQRYVEALSLDIFVLQSLLKQHRCSHGRTKYFQRISMVLRALERYKLLDFPDQMETMRKDVNGTSQELIRKKKRQQKLRSSNDDEWYIPKANADGRGTPTKEDKQLDNIIAQLSNIQQTLLKNVPEVLLRIQHASSALFVEVGRAFFLPFCTVALGALARIRVLILRFGFQAATELQQLRQTFEEVLGDRLSSSSSSTVETTTLNFFLTHQSLEQTMQQYAEQPPKSRDPGVSKQRNTNEVLANLGLQDIGGKKNTRSSSRLDETASTTSIQTEKSNDRTDRSDNGNESFAKEEATMAIEEFEDDDCVIAIDDDDVGEAVVHQSTINSNPAQDAARKCSSASGVNSIATAMHAQHALDRNMNLVQQHKAKRKREAMDRPSSDKKKQKTKKEKAHKQLKVATTSTAARRRAESSSPPTPAEKKLKKPSKKKKKERKSSKKDFFDKLFD